MTANNAFEQTRQKRRAAQRERYVVSSNEPRL